MAGLSSLQKWSLARLATMKITMTGAIGRIGKVTTQLLVDRGHEVVAVDIAEGPVPAGIKLHV
jgi:nucleoside-diphosphate-sugar epimerase